MHTNNFVPRRGTNNRQAPPDAAEQIRKMNIWVAHYADKYNILASLILAFDHTSLQILLVSRTTIRRARRLIERPEENVSVSRPLFPYLHLVQVVEAKPQENRILRQW